MKPSIRHAVAALAVLLTVSTLSPAAVSAAEDATQTRSSSTAFASRDFEPENQVDRLYLAVLGREPDAAGLAFWVSLYTSGTSLEAIANELSKSPEFINKYGNLDNAGFIKALYINVFGSSDAAGEAYWLGLLNTGQLTRSGVIVQLSESEQFRNQTFDYSPINRLYCAFFLRPPDAGGQAYWQNLYRQQNVGLEPIAAEFAASQEFTNTYGALSNSQFVELIYKNVLGRPIPILDDIAGFNYWTGLLGRNEATRGKLMIGFSESQEYKNRFADDGSCPPAGKATPIVVNDRGTVVNAGSVTVNWAQNDTVPTGSTVTVKQGAKGSVKNNNDGTFTYTHNGATAAATTDSFTYTVTSSDGVPATATVSITILAQGADGIPTAVDDVVTTDYETPVVISWATNDTTDDTVSVQSLGSAANGTVVNNGNNTFTYTPNTGFAGTDTFNYTLQDDQATPDVSTASVTITVGANPGADDGVSPVATDDRVITKVNTAIVIDWAGNDSLVDSGYLADFTAPDHGTVVDNGNGTFTYTPDTDYTASRTGFGLVADAFSYTLRDDDAGVSSATVDVVVLAQPECEVFMNYPFDFDVNTFELFFSDKGCFELYSPASVRDVVWSGVTLNGAAVGTTSGASVLREFVAVSPTVQATNRVDLSGTATLTIDGASAVVITFRIAYDWDAGSATWLRDNSVFQGRGTDDVTILINPLA